MQVLNVGPLHALYVLVSNCWYHLQESPCCVCCSPSCAAVCGCQSRARDWECSSNGGKNTEKVCMTQFSVKLNAHAAPPVLVRCVLCMCSLGSVCVCVCVCLRLCLSVCLWACLCVCLYVCMSVCVFDYIALCIPTWPRKWTLYCLGSCSEVHGHVMMLGHGSCGWYEPWL